MRLVGTLAFIALLAFGKFSTLSNHWRTVVACQSGDTGDDSGDDDSGDDEGDNG